MKKKGLLVSSVLGMAAMAATLVGCGPANEESAKGGIVKNADDAFAFSAVSGCTLLTLDTMSAQTVMSCFAAAEQAPETPENPDDSGNPETPETPENPENPETPETPSDPLEAQIAEVTKYINMFEGMIGSNALNTVTEENVVYNEVEYAIKSTVTVPNLDGTNTVYVMYYNETELAAEKDDDDEEEQEVESKLEGILVLGSLEYAIEGEKELEEGEMEVHFTASAADGTRIDVKQEIEEEEQSFEYKLFDAEGNLLQESKVELEQEKDETEIELELKDAEGNPQKYSFEKETEDGETEIKVKYTDETGKLNVCKVKVVTDETTGESKYVFQFEDGREQSSDRVDFDDEEEDD